MPRFGRFSPRIRMRDAEPKQTEKGAATDDMMCAVEPTAEPMQAEHGEKKPGSGFMDSNDAIAAIAEAERQWNAYAAARWP